MRASSFFRRALGGALLAGSVVLLTGSPAGAHVSVSSPDAAPGGYAKLVFRVPNESDTAATTKLQVQLPADTPFTSVSSGTLPGWTVEAEPQKLPEPVEVDGATLTEAVTTVTWTAQDGGVPVGQFEEFELSVGRISEDVDRLVLPAVQTYEDGEVREWTQVTEPGGEEPESPAPVLELAASSAGDTGEPADDTAGDTGGTTEETATQTAPTGDAPTAAAEPGADGVARGLGLVAVLLALAALVWSVLSGRRGRG